MMKPIKNTLENRVKTEFINYFQQVGNLEMSTSIYIDDTDIVCK